MGTPICNRNSKSVVEAFEASIRARVPDGARLILGVSGGVDSVVLAHVLAGCVESKGLAIIVAHVNHGLRPSAAADELFVKKLSDSLGLEFEHSAACAGDRRKNLEQWGRTARYSFFRKLRTKHSADFIVTAHSASDVVETYLMRLVANKEMGRGIIEVDRELSLLRPMLRCMRSEIQNYAHQSALEYCEDETNRDLRFLRNQVRHVLLPCLKGAFGEHIERELLEHGRRAASDWIQKRDFTSQHLSEVTQRAQSSTDWFQRVAKKLMELDREKRWLLIQAALYPELKFNLGRQHCERVEEFLLKNRRQVQLPGGVSITRRKGQICWSTSFGPETSQP